jgi:hypothetical protein
MTRFAVLVTLLFALLWQAVGMARAGLATSLSDGLPHAALHWQDEPHHHHDDGSYHADDSQASTHHLLCDLLTVTTALPPPAVRQILPGPREWPGAWIVMRVPEPFIDGPMRPPRQPA